MFESLTYPVSQGRSNTLPVSQVMLSRYVVHVQSYLLYVLENEPTLREICFKCQVKIHHKVNQWKEFHLRNKTYIFFESIVGYAQPISSSLRLSNCQRYKPPRFYVLSDPTESNPGIGWPQPSRTAPKVIRWPPASPLIVAVQSLATQTAQRLTALPVEQAVLGGWGCDGDLGIECMELDFSGEFFGWVLKIRHFGWLGLYGWSRRYKEQLKRFCCKSLGMSWKKKADPPQLYF